VIDQRTFLAPGDPAIVGHKAYIPCGCCVIVGLRTDTREAATTASPCSPEHLPLMERFNLALGDTLVNPSDRALIEVVNEVLEGLDVATP
jgi:hypothetical protein